MPALTAAGLHSTQIDVARGLDCRETFQVFRPGFDLTDPAFFRCVAEAAPCQPDEILYVADRLDNDIRPATDVGLRTALIRRGPWGTIQQRGPDADLVPTIRIDSLDELPAHGWRARRTSRTRSRTSCGRAVQSFLGSGACRVRVPLSRLDRGGN